ncbi:hypothetical protein PTKIN_Ptkin04bG0057400 [Pterospermum kingtungense]
MGEAKAIQDKVNQTNFSFQDKQNPTHLTLKQTQLSNPNNNIPPQVLDLNLRLSLGGIYTTGNTRENPLTRSSSSSIAGVVTLEENCSELEKSLPKSFLSLARSCSLPAEVESNKKLVNVKELRIMRRVEAKKRAEEKDKKANDIGNLVMEGPPSSPTKIPAWAAASAAKSPALNRAIDKIKEGFRKLEGLQGPGTRKAPIRTVHGESVKLKHDETKYDNPSKKAKLCNGWIQDDGTEVMKKMPSVTTTGDGPNGRTVEGFLYKYMKGQVSIVCVCHGSFLSPEEFVKHAGGDDVTNPMKHINVCSTPFS